MLSKEEIEKAIKIFTELDIGDDKEFKNARKIILNYIDNSISKEVIEKKIKELKQMRDTTIVDNAYNIFNGEMIVLQELLEGK